MSKTWNICMVGMGYWSDVHFDAWQSLGGRVRISAIADHNPDKLEAKAGKYGFSSDQLHLSLDEALKRPDIDIVDVITRPDSHLEMVEKAARAGKHILCQKPFAPTIGECREIVRICEKNGVRLMVAEGWRWQSHYLALKQIIGSGVLGSVYYAKLSAKWFFTPRFGDPATMSQPYFRDMQRLFLYEMGPHYIDAYRFLFGEPDDLTAVTRRISPYIQGDDLAILIFRHAGMTGMIEGCWASREQADGPFTQPGGENLMEYALIEGTQASVRLSADGIIELIHDGGGIERVEYGNDAFQNSHNRLHAHFVNGLESGSAFATSGEEYLKVMDIIETAYAQNPQNQ